MVNASRWQRENRSFEWLWLLSRKDGIDRKRPEWSLLRGNRKPTPKTEHKRNLNCSKCVQTGPSDWATPQSTKIKINQDYYQSITTHSLPGTKEAERCWKAGDSGALTSKDGKQINVKNDRSVALTMTLGKNPQMRKKRKKKGVLCVLRRTKCGHQGALGDKARAGHTRLFCPFVRVTKGGRSIVDQGSAFC